MHFFTLISAQCHLELLEQIEQKYLDDYKVCKQGYNVALLVGKVSVYPKKKTKYKKKKKGQAFTEYNELKTRITVSITPTAVNGIDEIADSLSISRSELIEQIGRGLLKVVPGDSTANSTAKN